MVELGLWFAIVIFLPCTLLSIPLCLYLDAKIDFPDPSCFNPHPPLESMAPSGESGHGSGKAFISIALLILWVIIILYGIHFIHAR